MSRLVLHTIDEAIAIVLPLAPLEARSISARIAFGLGLGDDLRSRTWPTPAPARIELQEAGIGMLVAIGLALPSIPVEGARVEVHLSVQGKIDAETPFGREVVAKFMAQLKARGAVSVSC